MTAKEKIESKTSDGFHICVGLDSDITKIPQHLLKHSNPILEFNKVIIENTYKEASAYKINFAFYEKDGSRGFDTIHKTMELIPDDVLTIADAKRGDIGNTSQMYAQSIFDHFGFDAVTLHPYMGLDSLSPFLEYKNKLNFILALTSNSGASDFENCGLVFGATKIDELKNNIESFRQMPILLPGVGTQGGSLEDVTRTFFLHKNMNFIINISRALIYSDNTENFGIAISKTIKQYNSTLHSILAADK
ncbi:MAG: orotidine-5'-phosphate decarboxylase [Melioribacteraceae bacterium]